jgi:cell division protein ZapA
MAALTISDELADVAGKMRQLEAELAALQDARAASSEHAKATQVAVAAALNASAERIESIVRRLNQTQGNGTTRNETT